VKAAPQGAVANTGCTPHACCRMLVRSTSLLVCYLLVALRMLTLDSPLQELPHDAPDLYPASSYAKGLHPLLTNLLWLMLTFWPSASPDLAPC
jgi:hypothetical protein